MVQKRITQTNLILNFMGLHPDEEYSIDDIENEFGFVRSSIRRVLGVQAIKGTIERVGRGLYSFVGQWRRHVFATVFYCGSKKTANHSIDIRITTYQLGSTEIEDDPDNDLHDDLMEKAEEEAEKYCKYSPFNTNSVGENYGYSNTLVDADEVDQNFIWENYDIEVET